jgi:hypothetical protein
MCDKDRRKEDECKKYEGNTKKVERSVAGGRDVVVRGGCPGAREHG